MCIIVEWTLLSNGYYCPMDSIVELAFLLKPFDMTEGLRNGLYSDRDEFFLPPVAFSRPIRALLDSIYQIAVALFAVVG